MGPNYYWYPAVVDEDVTWLRGLTTDFYEAYEAETAQRLNKIADRIEQLLTNSEGIHIGKSSFGWQFSFQTFDEVEPPIRSWKAWQEVLQTGVIKDEYDKVVTLDELCALIESKRGGKNHAVECKPDGYLGDYGSFLDDEGHSFTTSEFS